MGDPLTGWRKIAGAAWDAPRDPQIYGMLAGLVFPLSASSPTGFTLLSSMYRVPAIGRALDSWSLAQGLGSLPFHHSPGIIRNLVRLR